MKIIWDLKFNFILLILFSFTLPYKLFALKIDSINEYFNEKGHLVITFGFKDFPAQEVILALKRQKEEVQIIYEIELYRKGFLRDQIVDKRVYYQRAGYLAEKNLYFLEDNNKQILYQSPEDLVRDLLALPTFTIPSVSYGEVDKKNFFLMIHITLKYKTHLTQNLRYTHKEREVIKRVSQKY
ncbi:MAG: hypothetical protein ACK4Y7_05345, partial [Caldimicrobium sp.]